MKDKILTFIVPFICVGVALFHLYNVNRNNLSRWKGGGFGMYTEINEERRIVWIEINDSALSFSSKTLKEELNEAYSVWNHQSEKKEHLILVRKIYKAIRRVKNFPQEKHFIDLARKLQRLTWRHIPNHKYCGHCRSHRCMVSDGPRKQLKYKKNNFTKKPTKQ